MSAARPRLIGLTGGIACGKSAVSARLAARGAAVVDADEVARAVVAPGSAGLAAVAARFGAGVLRPDGSLDRAALGALVFGDPAARAALEGITHPLIAAESARRVAEALAGPAPLVVYDAALLVESGRAEQFRPLVVVWASPEVQRARLVARDGLSAEQAEGRLRAQLSTERKRALADFVVENDGDLAALDEEVGRLWGRLVGAEGG